MDSPFLLFAYMFIVNKIIYCFIYFFYSACSFPYPYSLMVTAAYTYVPTVRILKKKGVNVKLGVVAPLDPARHLHSYKVHHH